MDGSDDSKYCCKRKVVVVVAMPDSPMCFSECPASSGKSQWPSSVSSPNVARVEIIFFLGGIPFKTLITLVNLEDLGFHHL